MKHLEKEQENESSEKFKQEIKKHEEEERKRAEELILKNKIYASELKKQYDFFFALFRKKGMEKNNRSIKFLKNIQLFN